MKTNNSQILGKSITDKNGNNITLFQHTQDVYNAFQSLKNKVNGILSEELCQIIQLTIFLHDIGKVLPSFQIKSLKNTNYQPFDIHYTIPHSLFSLFMINKNELQECVKNIVRKEDSENYMQWIISSIAYHHWRENFPDFLQNNNFELNEISNKIKNEWKNELIDKLKNEFENSTFNIELIGLNEQMLTGLINGLSLSEYATPPYYLYWLPKRIVNQEQLRNWVLISGFTMLCDHFASFCEQEQSDLNEENIEIQGISTKEIKHKIIEKIKKQKSDFKESDLWQYEVSKDYIDKNTVLIAPTGFGKTEFAWLWSDGKKFFYTLPLRSAVNQNFNRTEEIFGKNKAGILHSDADVYLLGDGGETDNLKSYDLAKQLAYPAMVSTGDQFFPYALRPPGYEKIFAKFSYSKLIIDEVQAYDPKAAAIVVKFLEHIDYMGGKFLLMTATLPEFIKVEIETRISDFNVENIYDIYKEKDGFSQTKKHKIELKLLENNTKNNKPDFQSNSDYLKDVINEAQKGQRVLVITNTIAQAQYLYNQIKELCDKNDKNLKEKVWLLHSRFTLNKRKEIEKNVVEKEFSNPKPLDEKVGKILVSTQVVEASLDMDADILFTEIAPIDALVQRMGRVMRRRRADDGINYEKENPNVFIWIYKNGIESGNRYVYHRDLLSLSIKILSEKTLGNETIDYKNWLENYDTKKLSVSSEPVADNSKKNELNTTPIFIPQTKTFTIDEYEKYEMINSFYQLPANSEYLTLFYQTLDILDAGYMSDRKSEAQRIFREINDVSIVPVGDDDEKNINDFITTIIGFFQKEYEDKGLYSKFKNDVLSKYIVQIQYYKVKDNLVQCNKAYEKIKFELEEEYGFSRKQLNRLSYWLRGIYIIPVKYNTYLGFTGEEVKTKTRVENKFL